MFWLVLLIILGVVGVLADDETPCTLHHNGKYFDLNPLKSNTDYEFQTTGGHVFTINACRNPVRESHGLKDVNEKDIGGFIRQDHRDFSIGTLNTTLSVEDSRPRLTFSNGSRCKSKSGDNQIRASTVVEFVCDSSVFGSGMPRLVAQLPPGDDEDACAFFIEWKTHVACPTNEPGGAWGFFSFIPVLALSIVIMYLVFGTLYNRYVLRLSGVDQIPQFSITSMKYHAREALDWMKDIAIRMHEGGRSIGANSGFFPGSSLDSESELGRSRGFSRTDTNPISHQNQTYGREGSTGPVSGGGGGGNFMPRMRSGVGNGRRGEINPISHQAQSRADNGESSSSPSSPALPGKEKPRPKPIQLESTGSTREEREFMLADDEDDESDDVGMTLSKPAPAPSHPPEPAV